MFTTQNQIVTTAEGGDHSPAVRRNLAACLADIRDENPTTREEVALIVRKYGFEVHKGGCHVAIFRPLSTKRIAIITHPTAPDFN